MCRVALNMRIDEKLLAIADVSNDDPIHPADPNKRCPMPTWSKQKLFHNIVINERVLHIQLNGDEYVPGPKTTFHRFSRHSHSSVIC